MPASDYEPSSLMKRRLFFGVFGPVVAGVVAIVAGLGNLTINQHQHYAEMANRTHFTNKTITASRGTIYDAKGAPLAWSATVYKVYIDPSQFRKDMDAIEKVMDHRRDLLAAGEELPAGTRIMTREELEDEIVDVLSTSLKISQDAVLTAMEKDSQYVVLKNQVDKAVADDLIEYFAGLGMESVSTQQDSKRYYPQNEMAAQVIGFTSGDGDGLYGLEKSYDEYLSGVNGRTTSAKDAQGNAMPYRYSTTYPAQDGASLYLTLDSTLQYCVEKNLQEMCEVNDVQNRATGILMNAKTGAIYAMGTYPSFDLNNPSVIADEKINAELQALPEDEYQDAYIAAREQQWKNKAISEVNVPGSVFKIFTASAAIEEKTVDWENYGYNCTGVYRVSEDFQPHCHQRGGHGYQNFQEIFVNSCNPAFIDIGLKLGAHKFCTYFDAFGLSDKTGIDLPGEVSSISNTEESMGIANLAASSYGQSNVLTPIEIITGIAAAINGGYLVQPHVVDKIVSSDGNIIKTNGTNVKRQVISEETSAVMRQILLGVVEDKQTSNAHIDGYKIGGKSGTGQKTVNGKVSEIYNVASYACFAPADDPEVVLLVIADEPMGKSYYGSHVAAPYASKIMEEALPYLGFYPEYTEEQIAKLNVTVPQFIDKEVSLATAALEEDGLNYTVKGEGEIVTGQCPQTGSSVSAGGTVVLYTDENYVPEQVEVPDLHGFTAEAANAALADLGLNHLTTGADPEASGTLVEEQSVEPGEMVDPGTVITLTYLVNSQSG